MSKFVLDLDDSSAEMVEMTEAEVDAFSKKDGLRQEKMESMEKRASKPKERREKSKRKRRESSSEEKATKPKRQRRKSEPMVQLTPEERFSRQIK